MRKQAITAPKKAKMSLENKVKKLIRHQQDAKELGINCPDSAILKSIRASI
jgi:hypothetical protein